MKNVNNVVRFGMHRGNGDWGPMVQLKVDNDVIESTIKIINSKCRRALSSVSVSTFKEAQKQNDHEKR